MIIGGSASISDCGNVGSGCCAGGSYGCITSCGGAGVITVSGFDETEGDAISGTAGTMGCGVTASGLDETEGEANTGTVGVMGCAVAAGCTVD